MHTTRPLLAAMTGGALLVAALTAPASAQVFRTADPFVTNPGAGAGGADNSVLDSSASDSILGFGAQTASNNRVADDFTVADAAGWDLDSITTYAYQTGSTTTSTITGATLRIWNGQPDDTPSDTGPVVVFGDATTNRMTSTSWTNAYRVTSTTLADTQRPIMRVVIAADVTLPQGTYWVDYSFSGSLASGPWAVPVTIAGTKVTGNARQSTAGVWGDVTDNGAVRGMPFVVNGSVDTSLVGTPVTDAAKRTATFSYTGSPSAVLSGFECRLDAGAWAACNGGSATLTGVAAGAHTFEVRAVGSSGERDLSPASVAFSMPAAPVTTPPTPADTVAPVVTLAAKAKQTSSRKVSLKASCDENCTGSVGAKVVVKTSPKKSFTVKAKAFTSTAGGTTKVVLSLPRKARAAVKAAQADGRKVVVKVTGTAADQAGNTSRRSAIKVALVAKKRAATRPAATPSVSRVVRGAAAELG